MWRVDSAVDQQTEVLEPFDEKPPQPKVDMSVCNVISCVKAERDR